MKCITQHSKNRELYFNQNKRKHQNYHSDKGQEGNTEEVILIGPWQHLSCVLDGMWPAAYWIQQALLRFIRGTRWTREG